MSYYYSNSNLFSNALSYYSRYVLLLLSAAIIITSNAYGQSQISGEVINQQTGDPIAGATVRVANTQDGVITDQSGKFSLKTSASTPLRIITSQAGFNDAEMEVSDANKSIKVELLPSYEIEEVQITSTALSERQKQSGITVESMSISGIRETSAANFYEGLGHMKAVDVNAASFGFKVVNTRGFNSTQPVRSLQLIDGVDNQSPGFNFSLGNFLGASELDLESVDLVVGASSAFFGPNAFNGVIDMRTKDPFIHRGLSASIKGGERNWVETAVRYAKVFKNKKGKEKLAIKVNLFYLTANDWVADNMEEAYRDTSLLATVDYVGIDNPGGYDAVNRYGDETANIGNAGNQKVRYPGLGIFYRPGYEERDLLDYDTRNLKASVALHYKLSPKVQLIAASSYSNGTTVFQGINRISLKGIQFFQHKIEVKQDKKFFLRAYMTHEDAGESYDPVFTAFRLQNLFTNDASWNSSFRSNYENRITPRIKALEGYPEDPNFNNGFTFDLDKQAEVLANNKDLIAEWHQEIQDLVNAPSYLVPGTPEFQMAFDSITSLVTSTEGGTRFFDRSALFHVHGEYTFETDFADIIVGANGRMYTPRTAGSIFSDTIIVDAITNDTSFQKITNLEYGAYLGLRKSIFDEQINLTATLRTDRNQNFNQLFSPAITAMYKINGNENNTIRMSVSSAIRNPTLADQYLYYNIGPARLVGNIDGYENLLTLESLREYLDTRDLSALDTIDIPRIRPEKVITIEGGARALLGENIFVDANYYYSRYQDFIGFRFAFDGGIFLGFPAGDVLRVAANSDTVVTTQGASIGINYFFPDKAFTLGGNYSWNVLNTQTDDPIVPAFNTPEHKFNINFSGRDFNIPSIDKINFPGIKRVGFNLNFKWVQGFLFEGSPQFTGFVPAYHSLDVQLNKFFPKIKTTVKLGASNIYNNRAFTVYGGPRIGRLAYISLNYDFSRN